MTPDEVNKLNKADELAQSVLKLSRNTLLVNLRFLDMALSRFKYIGDHTATLAVDGEHIFYNPRHVLSVYKTDKEQSVRDYLHMVLHCVFRHNFVDTLVNTDCWDLACDIAVENVISELDLPSVNAKRKTTQTLIMAQLKENVKQLTAEKIYRYYLDLDLSPLNIAEIRKHFTADDHAVWYLVPEELEEADPNKADENTKVRKISGQLKPSGASAQGNMSGDPGKKEGKGNAQDRSINHTPRSELQQSWKDISERMQVDIETFKQQRGDTPGDFMQNLREVNREKYDYADFLRRFAVMGEAMKINDEEFDNIFYTYGLKLYDRMPLIEPLEYKDVKKIKEFVIAIDTSGSVRGEIVQKFIQKTYNILKQEESYFRRFNLHIIQCDATIQEDAVIRSQEEFDNYLKTMTLKGFGGTDFRPVFGYVDWLREKKDFVNLKGLIYFTDGYGVFPEKKPDYSTAFVFLDDNYNNYEVPPWAIKLVLQSGDI